MTAPSPRPAGRLQGLLQTPLAWKLLTPWLIGSVGVVAWAMRSGADLESVPMLAGLVILFAGWGTAAMRVALRPLRTLSDTARRVTAGDDSTRAPRSPLSDPEMAQLIDTFNEMLDALEAERHRRQADAAWLVEAEERQRERVAGELFAGPAQTLAGVLVRLRLLYAQLSDSPPGEAAGELVDEVRDALEEIQTLARRLRPPELAELGTRAAVQALVRRLEGAYGIEVTVTGTIPDDRLAPAARSALFRIVEDCLADLLPAPPTTPTTLHFRTEGDTFITELHRPPLPAPPRADGAVPGPPPSAPPGGPQRWRVVGHRAELVGGRMSHDGDERGATRLRVELPLRDPSPHSGVPPSSLSSRSTTPVSRDPQEFHGP